jgi:threonine synthase
MYSLDGIGCVFVPFNTSTTTAPETTAPETTAPETTAPETTPQTTTTTAPGTTTAVEKKNTTTPAPSRRVSTTPETQADTMLIVIGVVSAHAPAYALSLAARRAIEAPVSTVIADGMACRTPDPTALEILLREVDEVVQVTDLEVAGAMKALYVDTHNVAEGAGAASLAAAIQLATDRPGFIRGKQIGLTLCGGNVDHDLFARVLNG